MVKRILRKLFPKLYWQLEKRVEWMPRVPIIEFHNPPQNGDMVTIFYISELDQPSVVDKVIIDGRILEKDEYDVR